MTVEGTSTRTVHPDDGTPDRRPAEMPAHPAEPA